MVARLPVCVFVPVGRDYSRANSPPMHVSRGTLSIMQNHYPERLHHCFLVNAPWLFRAGWRVRLWGRGGEGGLCAQSHGQAVFAIIDLLPLVLLVYDAGAVPICGCGDQGQA